MVVLVFRKEEGAGKLPQRAVPALLTYQRWRVARYITRKFAELYHRILRKESDFGVPVASLEGVGRSQCSKKENPARDVLRTGLGVRMDCEVKPPTATAAVAPFPRSGGQHECRVAPGLLSPHHQPR